MSIPKFSECRLLLARAVPGRLVAGYDTRVLGVIEAVTPNGRPELDTLITVRWAPTTGAFARRERVEQIAIGGLTDFDDYFGKMQAELSELLAKRQRVAAAYGALPYPG